MRHFLFNIEFFETKVAILLTINIDRDIINMNVSVKYDDTSALMSLSNHT